LGLLAALLETGRSGNGQVVDAAMVDGAASLMTMFYGLHAGGFWQDRRGSNILDGAAPFYRAYRTSDQQYVIVCAIERRFFEAMIELLGIDDIDLNEQHDKSKWPQHIERFETIFAGKTRDEWCALLEGTDACFAPVLSLMEAPQHAHNISRSTFVDVEGVIQPAPAPRFSRTASEISQAPTGVRSDIRTVLIDWGLSESEVSDLAASV
jgi:alpha-methylacyl-CoA racemase